MSPDLQSYDRVVVAFSGGKDSIASLLTVLLAAIRRDLRSSESSDESSAT